MPELTRYANDTLFTCKPGPGGVYYVHWSEGGRSKRKTTGTRDVRGAQAFFDEWCNLIDTDAGKPRRYTCDELFEMRYGDRDPRVTAAWANLKPHFGHLTPAEVTQAVEDAYKVKRGVAPSTLRYELSILRACWNGAVKARLLRVEDTPVLRPLPAPSPPRERVLTEDELDRVLAAAERPGRDRVRLFVWLAAHTGARRNAICDLRWPQVDFDMKVVHFLPEGARQTRKRRASVPMSDALHAVLKEAYERRAHDNALVIGSGGKINSAVAALGKLAGVSGLTPHVFRHTAGTIMLKNNVSIWTVANILGDTVETVEKTYAKWVPNDYASAVNVIGRPAAHRAQIGAPT